MQNASAKIEKEQFERLYQQYNCLNTVDDPVRYPHQYSESLDKELIAFLSAVFAYGRVTQINAVLDKIVTKLGKDPVSLLLKSSEQELRALFRSIYHRFYTAEDVTTLLLVLKKIYTEAGSLECAFRNFFLPGDLQCSIAGFHSFLANQLVCISGRESVGMRFMFPDAAGGSACKRTNLYLRWMVRKDAVDLGLWTCLHPADLIIPLDTHIARVSQYLGLTYRKSRDWKMAKEITDSLRQIDPVDPVRFDFALCHFSMKHAVGCITLT